MELELKLELKPRKPRWWEKKWKPKKPTLYILEYQDGKWINTYWWGGVWKRGDMIEFSGSGCVKIDCIGSFRWTSNLVIVGRSGTTLITKEGLFDNSQKKVKSLNPRTSEWTCFGKISVTGIFLVNPEKFNLEEEIKARN